jgi:hypothetical protein
MRHSIEISIPYVFAIFCLLRSMSLLSQIKWRSFSLAEIMDRRATRICKSAIATWRKLIIVILSSNLK